MKKKEVLEIKKQLSPINCCLTRIAGCYVNAEKEIVSTMNKPFLRMDEEEIFKFLDLFKKGLSGSIGKQLLPMEYKEPSEQQKLLLELRNSRLQNSEILMSFYEQVINSYETDGYYYIALVHGVYDIPGKTTDGETMEDASEEVYEHLIGVICPVSLDKPSLVYNAETQDVENKVRDWVLGQPDCAFLYPAFSERTACVNELLYYSKKADDLQENLIHTVFAAEYPNTAKKQAEAFSAAAELCGLTFENAKELKEELTLQEEEDENTSLESPERAKLCERYGMNASQMEETLKEQGVQSLQVSNLFQKNKTSIRTDNVEIKVPANLADLIQIKNVDGEKCLVIRPDGKIRFDDIPVTI